MGRLWFLVALGLSGCVPVAWVVPPMRMEVGVGAAGATSGPTPTMLETQLAASIHPLQVMETWVERPLDLGLGGELLWTERGARFGPSLSAAYLTPPLQDWGTWWMRGGAEGRAALLFGQPELGVRGSVRGFVEFVSFANSRGLECNLSFGSRPGGFCGPVIAYGEGGLGLYVEVGGSGAAGGIPGWDVHAGLQFRIPASAGVGLVPIPVPRR